MTSRKTPAIPARLEAGRRRFEQWHRARKGRSPILERLWTSVVRPAEGHGLCRTARTLRLDYNICERALKLAILHRKNALFYKTENGAHVGDLFMSLIYTCQLGGVAPFDYLSTLQRHAAELSADPGKWMPWNYRNELGT